MRFTEGMLKDDTALLVLQAVPGRWGVRDLLRGEERREEERRVEVWRGEGRRVEDPRGEDQQGTDQQGADRQGEERRGAAWRGAEGCTAERCWSRCFPGQPCEISAARAYLAEVVGQAGCRELADDACLLVSELAGNAVLHTRSGSPGGFFVVAVESCSDGLRISVTDQGGQDVPQVLHEEREESGRGLSIVEALARRWDAYGDRESRTVWCELGCPQASAAPQPSAAGCPDCG